MLRGRLEGPFPYAFGTFYAVSQPLARWLAASPFVARAVAQLEADRWSRQMAYTEDLVFGWAVSRAANTSAVSFPKGNFDNFDAARGMQAHYRLAADCFRRANAVQRHDTTFMQLGKVYTLQEDYRTAIDVYLEALEFSSEG